MDRVEVPAALVDSGGGEGLETGEEVRVVAEFLGAGQLATRTLGGRALEGPDDSLITCRALKIEQLCLRGHGQGIVLARGAGDLDERRPRAGRPASLGRARPLEPCQLRHGRGRLRGYPSSAIIRPSDVARQRVMGG